ncbi:MAG: DUF1559 domain-containing protein [Pirellulaceae bacterium]
MLRQCFSVELATWSLWESSLPRSSERTCRKPFRRKSRAFTLVELLVVITIIGILIGLLLPAVQAARETARRMQCTGHVKQYVLALHNYHDTYRRFPSGYIRSNYAFWTSAILPYVEQDNVYDLLDFSVASNWAVNGSQNADALQRRYDLFLCPSEVNDHEQDHFLVNRVPTNYIACASGLVTRESGPDPGPQKLMYHQDLDGMIFDESRMRIADALDGTSNTIIMGEAINRPDISQTDYWNLPQSIDHWPIGSPSFGSNEVSEVMGTTAIAINIVLDRSTVPYIEERELCFSSRHPGSVNMGIVDGSVRLVAETIDRKVWSALGTRANGEVVSQ